MLKFSGSIIWRLGPRTTLRYASTSTSAFKTEKDKILSDIEDDKGITDNRGLVAAAFESLNTPENIKPMTPSPKSVKLNRMQHLDSQILKATDVNSLLLVAENSIVSRKHALKMVSVLSEWSSSNKVKLVDFEKDPRFLKLCRILARSPASQAMSSLTMAEDLGTVLGITGDDEAARLIANLSLQQMVKVMKALQGKGRRSTPLLRALSHNIARQPEMIDLKKSADLLYSMAALNFPDPVLLDRICNDVIECLPHNEKPAVVSSITVSLGLLKYRHEPALDALAQWMRVHNRRDVAAAVVTLATLDYLPTATETDYLFQTAASLTEEEMVKPSAWLDLVFSLLVLERAELTHLTSVLKGEFIDKLLLAGEIPIPSRRKLMAIDAYLSLTQTHAHAQARLPEHISDGVPVMYTKEKLLYVQSILDTFRSLVTADTFLRKNCDSGMGFLYDAEFAVDAKCHPVPLEKAVNDKSVFRIAVLALDYHNMSRRAAHPLGLYRLYERLLRLQGFKVLKIPYTEYSPKDKLITRVQYIEKRLKEIVNDTSAPL